jgi:hypothetical protein
MSKQRDAYPLLRVLLGCIRGFSDVREQTMGTALLVIVYLTNSVTGGNMVVTQFDVRPTQVFSSRGTCLAALQNVLAQAVANMKVNAICMDL